MWEVPTLPPELRRVPPESFVAARDALSRRLRQQGERDAAAEVRRLRRPPPPLWALNQLAAVAPDRVAQLIDAGEALRKTTQQALRGGRGALGRLSGEHARLVERLTGQAMEILAGLPAPATSETRSRIWTMLRVASLDPALSAGLTEGSLAEEPVTTGFDTLLGFDLGAAPSEAPPPEAAPPKAEPAEAPPASTEPAEAHLAAPPGRKESRTGAARRRREQAERLRAAIAQARDARAELERRRERLAQARRRAADLRRQAESAEREAEQAHQDADEAERSVEAAEAAVEELRTGETD